MCDARDLRACATWRISMCDMTHLYVRRDAFICATWRIYMCDMTHLYVRRDAFTRAIWLSHWRRRVSHAHSTKAGTPFHHTCAPRLMYMCDMTHLHVQHDAHMCAIWHSYMCDMTVTLAHAHHTRTPHTRRYMFITHVRHDLYTCVTWRMCNCHMTHICVWRDVFICMTTWLLH